MPKLIEQRIMCLEQRAAHVSAHMNAMDAKIKILFDVIESFEPFFQARKNSIESELKEIDKKIASARRNHLAKRPKRKAK